MANYYQNQDDSTTGFAPSADDMQSLVAELYKAGDAARQSAADAAREERACRKQFECAPNAVPLVVGHSGERLRAIEQRTGARIRVASERYRAKVFVEADDIGSCELAADLVEKSLELGQSPQRMAIPRAALGRVIGRNGERIKSIMERSGAHVRVQQAEEPCFVEMTCADPMAICVAREMILSFLDTEMSAAVWSMDDDIRAMARDSVVGPGMAANLRGTPLFASLPSPLGSGSAAAVSVARQQPQQAPTGPVIDPYKYADVAWASAQDEHGRTYYYNTITQQTTWDKPPQFNG